MLVAKKIHETWQYFLVFIFAGALSFLIFQFHEYRDHRKSLNATENIFHGTTYERLAFLEKFSKFFLWDTGCNLERA